MAILHRFCCKLIIFGRNVLFIWTKCFKLNYKMFIWFWYMYIVLCTTASSPPPQIRVCSEIFCLISQPKHMLWVLKRTKNCLYETVLLSTQNTCLKWLIRKQSQFYADKICLFGPIRPRFRLVCAFMQSSRALIACIHKVWLWMKILIKYLNWSPTS